MKFYYTAVIIIILIALGCMVYYFHFINGIKRRNKMISEQAGNFEEKFKLEGLDKYYESIGTEVLINEHKNILDSFDMYKDDLMKIAEMCSKEKLILDVLEARGIDINEVVNKNLGNE